MKNLRFGILAAAILAAPMALMAQAQTNQAGDPLHELLVNANGDFINVYDNVISGVNKLTQDRFGKELNLIALKLGRNFTFVCDLTQPLYNFHQLSPGVYRSARPQPAGIDTLKSKGVRTILNFWTDVDMNPDKQTTVDAEKAAGFAFESIPLDWALWPTHAQLDKAISIMTDPAMEPVDMHCSCGNDRTGVVSGAYRVVVQGWDPARAAAEARANGFHLPAVGDLGLFLASYAEYRAKAGLPMAKDFAGRPDTAEVAP